MLHQEHAVAVQLPPSLVKSNSYFTVYTKLNVLKFCFTLVVISLQCGDEQVGITRNSAASLCRGSPRLCNEYLLFRFPNLS